MRLRGLANVRLEALACVRCPLAMSRTQVVFGDGDPDADLMLIGEAPGKDEDRHGRPFLGAAGKNLDRFLEEIGLDRSEVYLANVAMCRPPANRRPRQVEIVACASYLDDQIRLVEPRVIIALGAAPTKRLLGLIATVAGSRGRVHRIGHAMVVPTYHPSPLSLNRAPERLGLIQADFRSAKNLLSLDRLTDG
jgi:uracil-DNA glycosylase family 4